MANVILTNPDTLAVVTVKNVPKEAMPVRARRLEVKATVDGGVAVYTTENVLEELAIDGRVEGLAGGLAIIEWMGNQAAISCTDLSGTTSPGWRIRPDTLAVARIDGETDDLSVKMRLWRTA